MPMRNRIGSDCQTKTQKVTGNGHQIPLLPIETGTTARQSAETQVLTEEVVKIMHILEE